MTWGLWNAELRKIEMGQCTCGSLFVVMALKGECGGYTIGHECIACGRSYTFTDGYPFTRSEAETIIARAEAIHEARAETK